MILHSDILTRLWITSSGAEKLVPGKINPDNERKHLPWR